MSSGNQEPDATDRSPVDQSEIEQIRNDEVQIFVNFIDEGLGLQRTGSRMGNGFAFTPAQLDNVATQTQDQMNQLTTHIAQIQPFTMAEVRPAPDSSGSGMYAIAVRKSFEYVANQMQSQRQYLKNWLNKLQVAKQQYMNNEHLTADQWNRQARGHGA